MWSVLKLAARAAVWRTTPGQPFVGLPTLIGWTLALAAVRTALQFAVAPTVTLTLGGLPPERLKFASGLFNLMRNLGGAIWLASINTLLNDRMDLHLARLHEAVNWARVPAIEMLSNLTARFQGSDAQLMALKRMTAMARQQAAVMSFADVFLMMTLLFVALAGLGLVMKRPKPFGAAAAAH